jgi:hypothetical protein
MLPISHMDTPRGKVTVSIWCRLGYKESSWDKSCENCTLYEMLNREIPVPISYFYNHNLIISSCILMQLDCFITEITSFNHKTELRFTITVLCRLLRIIW